MKGLRVTVSGSFHRHMDDIASAVHQLQALGAIVLSPADPRVVDGFGEFLFVASDVRRSIRGIQNRHFEAIEHSQLLWLVCPDGYVGTSASLEIGFAIRSGVPVFAAAPPSDLTLRQYVEVASSETEAAARVLGSARSEPMDLSLLLDPDATIDAAHSELETVRTEMKSARLVHGDPAESHVDQVFDLLTGPTGQR